MSLPEQYFTLSAELAAVCEAQRQAARSAQDFDQLGLPLWASTYREEARRLAERQFEILPILREFEGKETPKSRRKPAKVGS